VSDIFFYFQINMSQNSTRKFSFSQESHRALLNRYTKPTYSLASQLALVYQQRLDFKFCYFPRVGGVQLKIKLNSALLELSLELGLSNNSAGEDPQSLLHLKSYFFRTLGKGNISSHANEGPHSRVWHMCLQSHIETYFLVS
jgi:hypothetical protein